MVAYVNEYLFGFRLLSSGTACAEGEGEQEEKGEGEGGERGGEKKQHDDYESQITCTDSDRSLTSEHTCTYVLHCTIILRVLTQGFVVSEYTPVCSTWT